MTDFAQLVLSADSRPMVAGAKAGEHALDDLIVKAGHTDKATEGLAKGYQKAGKQSILAGHQSRMMAMQLSQVAQQASATGNWVQALAIQLPDLTLGFGTIGIAAGVAAGALLPLIANMVRGGEEADSFESSMDAVKSITDELKGSLDTLSLSAGELADKYGDAAERVYQFAQAQAEIRVGDARRELEAQSMSLGDLVRGYMTSSEEGLRFEKTIKRIQDTFGVTADQAVVLKDSFRDLFIADGFDAQQEALLRVTNLLSEYGTDLRDIPPDLADAVSKTITLSNATDEASAIASALAKVVGDDVVSSFNSASDAAANMAANTAAALRTAAVVSQLNQNGGMGLNAINPFNSTPFQDQGEIERDRWAQNFADSQAQWLKRQPKARSGGGSKKTDSMTDEMREAARVYEETRTALEQYNDELDDLQQLHDMGYLSADTYARAVEKVGEEYYNASEAGHFFNQISDELKDGILDAIVEGENLADTFESIAKSIAKAALEAALFGTGPFASGGAPSGGGGLLGGILGMFKFGGGADPWAGLRLPSMDGGGYTGSGSRSGGVDGKGGFPAILHPNETVIDHSRGQGASGAVVSQTVNIIDNVGVQKREERRRGPDGEEIVNIVLERTKQDMAQGGFDGAFGGRFGAAPVKVRRGGGA